MLRAVVHTPAADVYAKWVSMAASMTGIWFAGRKIAESGKRRKLRKNRRNSDNILFEFLTHG